MGGAGGGGYEFGDYCETVKQLGPKLYAGFSAVRRHLTEQLVHRMDLTRVELSHRRQCTHLLCMVWSKRRRTLLTGTTPLQCRQQRHDMAEHAKAEERGVAERPQRAERARALRATART